MTSLPNRLNRFRLLLLRVLEACSPLAFALLVIPFFLPVEHVLQRRLLLYGAALPGILLCLLDPKRILKNPVLWMIGLFVLYFSLQHLRGMQPITPAVVRSTIKVAVMIFFPAVILSEAKNNRGLFMLVITVTAVLAAANALFEMTSFYQEACFPADRFRYSSRMLCFVAILCAAGSLEKNRFFGLLMLFCLPALLLPAFYTHARTAPLAFFCAMLVFLIRAKNNSKKTIVLFSTIAATLLVYQSSLWFLQKDGSGEQVEPGIENAKTLTPQRSSRPGGFIDAGARGRYSANQRLYIWKDHLSRMNHAGTWAFGHGLGMKAFVKEPAYQRAAVEYVNTPHGYQLLAHSGYIWALYHGGLIGLSLLIGLFGLAAWRALRAKRNGELTLVLLVYSGVYMLLGTHRLLAGSGADYLLFWIPLGLAAGIHQSEK